MSTGPFQCLPGSHEMSGADALPSEPWLLPITDREAAASVAAGTLNLAVRKAARPFWIAANALCVALGLLLTVQCATGWMSPAVPRATGPVAAATPPTLAPQQAALVAHAE